MLAIRLQRTGRKGHAQFRMIVQDARRSPSSGRVVEVLGNYNPHTKETNIDKDKAATYLSNGAQPSDRAARILKGDGVKLPAWVRIVKVTKKTTKNPEKLRKNQPETPAEEPVEAPVAEESADSTEQPPEEVKSESSESAETPAEEPKEA